MDTVNLIPKGLVLITQTKKPEIFQNEIGGFGEVVPGFYISNPRSGLVTKDFWEKIKTFQKLELDVESIRSKIIVNSESNLSERDSFEILKWEELIKEDSLFCNTVIEFNLIISESQQGTREYRREIAILGKKHWKIVK